VKLWTPLLEYDAAALDAPPRLLEGNAGWVNSVAFSPDGATLASGNSDGTVRLWDAGAASERAVLRGHTDQALSVAFSPTRQRLRLVVWMARCAFGPARAP
jgi:WD40 repeat protein